MLKLTRPDSSFGIPLSRVGLVVLNGGDTKLRFDIEDSWCEIEGTNLDKIEVCLHHGLLAEIICSKPSYKAPPSREGSKQTEVYSIRFFKYIKKDIVELYPEM